MVSVMDNRETEYLFYMVADTPYTAELEHIRFTPNAIMFVHTVNPHKIMTLCVPEKLALVMP